MKVAQLTNEVAALKSEGERLQGQLASAQSELARSAGEAKEVGALERECGCWVERVCVCARAFRCVMCSHSQV